MHRPAQPLTRNLVSVAPSSVLPPPSSSPLPPFSSSLLVLAWGLSDKGSWCKHSEKLVESLQKQLIGLWRYTWEILSQAACNPTRRWRPNRSVGDVVVIESYSYYYRWYKQEWHNRKNRKWRSEQPDNRGYTMKPWQHRKHVDSMLVLLHIKRISRAECNNSSAPSSASQSPQAALSCESWNAFGLNLSITGLRRKLCRR